MNKKNFVVIFAFMSLVFNLNATKRTIPVDMILMIDKSISMEEPGRFDSLKRWVLDELIGQMVINGDWISIYQFYEKPEHLASLDIKSDQDRKNILQTIDSIKPNGAYTDIGRALDKMQAAALKRKGNNRYKILLLITDLEQDAPMGTKYGGKQKKFSSPYLVESRIIKRDKWYEITLDMSIQERLIKTSKELYSEINAQDGKSRISANQEEALIKAKEEKTE